MALGDSGHTAAVVPETASELEQLKEQVEKLTEMVARLFLSVSSGRRDSVSTVGVPGTFSETVRSVIAVSHAVGLDTLQRIVSGKRPRGVCQGQQAPLATVSPAWT